ncbi:MAG: extracellular solute-binding protein, partial [Chloroflexota bacterium]
MKRVVFTILLALLCSAVFTQTWAPFDPNKRYTVTIGAYGDLERAYTKVFASQDFKAKFPNITVKFQSADFGGHHQRLTTVIAAGQPTNDIEALEVGYIAGFVANGGLTNLGEYPYNGKQVGKDIVKFAMSNATTRDGKLVAMPVDIAPAVLFYRKDLADAAGVDLDNLKDWDAYIAAGKLLTKTVGGKKQYAIPNPGNIALVPLNGGKGGWFDRNGNLLEPKAKFVDALNLVLKVRRAGIDANIGDWSDPWSAGFKAGMFATMVNGAWFGGTLRTWMATESAGKWRVAYMPGKMFASIGGSYLAIPLFVPAERKAAAWEVIKYL